ncbi:MULTISPECIES: hypothetical protein [Streptomyces]|uniref:Secreted protein n=1 Tax=Streptomyces chartreusis NRRL 3882 TaxID=1079985 RepID=A0A2N9B745_STRCX|nr:MULTISPECIES: hypothetical protein [Streptomyces]MYS94883.1 hypothetical protein [Streptomyces sp. SID5464]SOR79154.1 hypothetical protein SCNRRL3882_2617 [Streptomyces chartreusis NRRL 3882]
MRTLLRAVAPAAALLSALVAAPQAVAEDHASTGTGMVVPGTGVQFSEAGARNPQTRAAAAEDLAAVRATASLCGSGYELERAERLPDERRFGTLFTYTKHTTGRHGACAVFDNNLGTAKKMKLKLCPNKTDVPCKVDEGTFSQYAGPVKYETTGSDSVDCASVTAIMWSNGVAIIDREKTVAACD